MPITSMPVKLTSELISVPIPHYRVTSVIQWAYENVTDGGRKRERKLGVKWHTAVLIRPDYCCVSESNRKGNFPQRRLRALKRDSVGRNVYLLLHFLCSSKDIADIQRHKLLYTLKSHNVSKNVFFNTKEKWSMWVSCQLTDTISPRAPGIKSLSGEDFIKILNNSQLWFPSNVWYRCYVEQLMCS